MSKKIFASVVSALAIFAMPVAGLADGGMIPPDWRYADVYEPQQLAFLVNDNGQEDLYLKVNYSGSAKSFVWIIPTPTLPNVTAAPGDLFEELSSLTTAEHQGRAGTLGDNAPTAEKSGGIIVHEQKQVGVYSITVLSATKQDNVYAWLQQNGFTLSPTVQDLLDWYVGKEWYFTAIKVDPQGQIRQAVSGLKPVDAAVSSDNLAESLAKHFSDALNNNDQALYAKITPILIQLGQASYDSPVGVYDLSRADLFDQVRKELSEYYGGSFGQQIEAKEKFIISGLIDALNTGVPSTGYLNPLKLSFASDALVYPLKISQVSAKPATAAETKTAEVLLYILSKQQVKAPYFAREYNQAVNPSKLESREKQLFNTDLDSLQAIITKEFFLTKLRRSFAKTEMDEDLYLINVPANETYGTLSNDATSVLTASYGQDPRYAQQIKQVRGLAMVDRLRGRIILRVEVHGEAYYINPVKKIRRYLGRAEDAFAIMREEGIGITNANLKKIPVAVTNVSGSDSDNDGLADPLEAAIGTNPLKADSDGDGLTDRVEVSGGFNPVGPGRMAVDPQFTKLHAGKIFLQVQAKGEAWYVNPVDDKRYFLGRPDDAYAIMRYLGLGISESDFSAL